MMTKVILPSLLIAMLLPAQPALAQGVPQRNSAVAIRQQRVELLRDEITQMDSVIESRLDSIVETLKNISDSKDSRTKVARMKEQTGKQLVKTIEYYAQKRATLREELRKPTLHLTDAEKRELIAVFDARIEKRTEQVLALSKSMPRHRDYQRYTTTGGGWYGTEYQRNEEFEQNRRMTSHTNTQRGAIMKQLDASIARLDRQARTLKTQIDATGNQAQRDAYGEELAKTNALIEERRMQQKELMTPSGSPTHTIALKKAMDLDKEMQTAINDLRRDFTTLFQRYNSFIMELSALNAAGGSLTSLTPHGPAS